MSEKFQVRVMVPGAGVVQHELEASSDYAVRNAIRRMYNGERKQFDNTGRDNQPWITGSNVVRDND